MSRNREQTPVRNRRRGRRRQPVVAWLFVLPILLIHIAVVTGPSLAAFYYALTDWSGVGPATFVGLANFQTLLTDDDFRRAFLNNLLWLAFFLTVPFGLALTAAALLAPVRRGHTTLRTFLILPYVLPAVITASLWRFLLNPSLGLGAHLAALGLPGLDQAFLGRPATALLTVAFVDNWHWWGLLMVLLLTAMQAIPTERYEIARLDGATRAQEFRYITLPGIQPTLVFMLLMTGIWSFLVFDYVWILTQGGPAGSSEVLGTLVYKEAFTRFNAGYAAAIGLSMSCFAGIIIVLFIALRRRGWEI